VSKKAHTLQTNKRAPQVSSGSSPWCRSSQAVNDATSGFHGSHQSISTLTSANQARLACRMLVHVEPSFILRSQKQEREVSLE
jgi:hypothetical protein